MSDEEDKKWIEQELEQGSPLEEIFEIDEKFAAEYELDFDKMNTVEDIKVILKAINFKFSRIHPGFAEFEHLMKESKK